MPKHLDSPIVVAAEIRADRFDITAYTVTVEPDQTVTIAYTCGHTNPDHSITVTAERTRTIDAGSSLDAAMAAATANIVSTVLNAAKQAQLVTQQQIDGVAAALVGNPTLARDAYYAGTRDALYGLL